MAFYDAAIQGQRISDSFDDEDCRIKLS